VQPAVTLGYVATWPKKFLGKTWYNITLANKRGSVDILDLRPVTAIRDLESDKPHEMMNRTGIVLTCLIIGSEKGQFVGAIQDNVK